MEKPIPSQMTDSELVAQWLQGDEQAFTVLYERYRLPLFGYLHRLLPGRRDLVDDVFQQVWTRAAQKLGTYQDQQKLLSWLFRIAHNLVMDCFRRGDGQEHQELLESFASETLSPDEELHTGELEHGLQEAISQLPPEQQDIVRQRLEGVSFKDIASSRKISLNTALGRMHYAIINLRRLMQEYL